MDNGVSKSIWFAIALVSVSALLSIIMYTVFLGNQVKSESMVIFSGLHSSISEGFVRDMEVGETNLEMPAATAYSILTSYSGIITESVNATTGRIINLQSEPTDIMTSLGGRVQLEFQKSISGSYFAIVHHKDCMWSRGYCTCAFANVANNYRTEYGAR